MLLQDERPSVGRIVEVFHDASVYEGIVIALAKAAAKANLTDTDKSCLEEAKRFLSRVQEGYEWPEHVSLSVETRACAASLSAAVKSFPEVGVSVNFLSDIRGMLSTVDQLLTRGTLADEEKLKELREFFRRLFRNTVSQFNEILLRPRIPRSFEWKVSGY